MKAPKGLLRLHIVNASSARYYNLNIPGKKLQVIGLDGSFLKEPVAMEKLLLTPGERADILIEATQAEELQLLNLPYSRTLTGPSINTSATAMALATFSIRGKLKR